MAVNSISVTNASVQSTQPGQASAIKQRRQDFEALTQALNSGDLSGAKSAFAAIQQDFKTVTQAQEGQQIGSNTQNKFQNAFQALGQALNSSDLKAAQTAFAERPHARGPGTPDWPRPALAHQPGSVMRSAVVRLCR